MTAAPDPRTLPRAGLGDAQDGAVTLWVLVLSVILLTLGGLSVDLWHVLSDRRELTTAADAAAFAAAGQIDEAHYRATGQVILRPDRGRAAALSILQARTGLGPELTDADIVVEPTAASVALHARSQTRLLRLLDPRLGALELTVMARAEPELVP